MPLDNITFVLISYVYLVIYFSWGGGGAGGVLYGYAKANRQIEKSFQKQMPSGTMRR